MKEERLTLKEREGGVEEQQPGRGRGEEEGRWMVAVAVID